MSVCRTRQQTEVRELRSVRRPGRALAGLMERWVLDLSGPCSGHINQQGFLCHIPVLSLEIELLSGLTHKCQVLSGDSLGLSRDVLGYQGHHKYLEVHCRNVV